MCVEMGKENEDKVRGTGLKRSGEGRDKRGMDLNREEEGTRGVLGEKGAREKEEGKSEGHKRVSMSQVQ